MISLRRAVAPAPGAARATEALAGEMPERAPEIPTVVEDPSAPGETLEGEFAFRPLRLVARDARGEIVWHRAPSQAGLAALAAGAEEAVGIFGDGIDLTLRRHDTGIAQALRVRELPALPASAERFILEELLALDPALRARPSDREAPGAALAGGGVDTAGGIDLIGAEGELAYHLPAPVAWDAGDDSWPWMRHRLRPLRRGAARLETEVAVQWLRDPARRWPVFIDPTADTLSPDPIVGSLFVAPVVPGSSIVHLAATYTDYVHSQQETRILWGDGEELVRFSADPIAAQHDFGLRPLNTVEVGFQVCSNRTHLRRCVRKERPAIPPKGGPPPAETSEFGRPCRGDLYVIEVPLGETRPLPASFADEIAIAAVERIGGSPTAPDSILCTVGDLACIEHYFCTPGDCRQENACPGLSDAQCADLLSQGEVDVQAVPVLDPAIEAWQRGDRHLRHYRLRFVSSGQPMGGVLPEPLWVRDLRQCDVVSGLRDAARVVQGVAQDHVIRVARECEAGVQGVDGRLNEAMRTWHLSRLGLDGGPAPPAANQARVALLDAAVPELAAHVLELTPDVAVQSALLGPDVVPDGDEVHRHGSGMAALVRQIAPVNSARLDGLALLDRQGNSVTADLANGISRALEIAQADPLVINLSLGFAPELSRASELRGEGCDTEEDGVGEVLRFALHEALLRDENVATTLIMAAAGNRPYEPDLQELYRPGSPNAGLAPCEQQLPQPFGPSFYFPAQWSRQRSCDGDSQVAPFVLAHTVGAVDAFDRPSSLSQPRAEPALVAPGELVYADPPDLDGPGDGVECLPRPESTRTPFALTGTSVAAALASGAAARLLSRLSDMQPPLLINAKVTWDLLYVAGVNVCRNNDDDYPVRRLSVRRLETLLECPREQLERLTDCLEQNLVFGNVCLPEQQDCGLEPLTHWLSPGSCFLSGGAVEDPPPANTTPPLWPAGYADPAGDYCDGAVCCEETTPPGASNLTVIDRQTCGAGLCPWETGPDRHSLGRLGPQPEDSGCPDCLFLVETTPALMHLYLELYEGFEDGTTFKNPWLVIRRGDLEKAIPLPVDTAGWEPGSFIVLKNLDASGLQGPGGIIDPIETWIDAKALLFMDITPPGGSPGTDVSGLRLEAVP